MSLDIAAGSVCDRLRQDILAGEYPFGGRLKIDALAGRYTTSHMPVREALRRLQGEGLILLEPNRGARVREVGVEFVRDMFDLRIAIEAMLARRAAERIGADQLAELEAIQREFEARAPLADYPGLLAANRAFHAVINRTAGNVEAIHLLDRHWNIIVALWGRHGYGAERVAGVISDHREILLALRQRDADGAAILATAHAAKAKQQMLLRFAKAAP
ncbi:MAG: GntR family transcriptional regulator [Tagaea sp.]|nr:GntR family transcriptional regulator [Tagaea sp.]